MTLFLVVAGGLALAVSQWLAFFFAPLEAEMGTIQKIFYLHFPLAIWALLYFVMVFIGSILYLLKKSASFFCRAAAETGVLCCALALITGMIWAKKSWGVWWTWDPRLVVTLVALFVYVVYLLIPGLDLPSRKKDSIQAVIGVIAFIDIPLTFLSARIFRSIHPAVFASDEGGLPLEMKLIVLVCCGAVGSFTLGMTLYRARQLENKARLRRLLSKI